MRKKGVGQGHVGTVGIVITAALLTLLTLALLYSLIQVWPPDSPAAGSFQFLAWQIQMSITKRLFLIVLIAGALGGSIHSLRSFYWYVGNRNIRYSWLVMYFALPIIGALLALITYLILRGGLTTTLADSEDVDPFGLTAVAALAGLFSREAAEKLRDVFETLLTPAEKGKEPAMAPTIVGVEPQSGRIGTSVTISGTGLADVSQVNFGAASTVPLTSADTELTVEVPAGATTGRVKVVGPSGTAESASDFQIV